MVWYNNPLIRPYVQSELKKINQRIAQIAKTYGQDSYTYKNAIAAFQKGPLSEFTSTSRSGNFTLDIRKIQKAIHSGSLNRSEANELLMRAAGIRINENGEVEKVGEGGIETVTEIRKKGKKKLENTFGEDSRDYTTKELDKFIEELNEFSASFQTAYNEAIKEVGTEKVYSDPVTGQLWGENRPSDHPLSYRQLTEIKKRLDELRKEGVDIVTGLEEE